MNRPTFTQSVPFALGLMIAFTASGCAPGIVEVSGRLEAMPIGISRSDLKSKLTQAYPREMRYWVMSAGPDTKPELLERIRREEIEYRLAHHQFLITYPSRLFDSDLSHSSFEFLPIIREAVFSKGHLILIYDSDTNYMGFFASADRKAK